ncbi:MAG: hypothetical protein HZA50_06790 [Planctomycetes bacterium]|nr:hypothetical protein [Planctomycetota bacterium]
MTTLPRASLRSPGSGLRCAPGLLADAPRAEGGLSRKIIASRHNSAVTSYYFRRRGG